MGVRDVRRPELRGSSRHSMPPCKRVVLRATDVMAVRRRGGDVELIHVDQRGVAQQLRVGRSVGQDRGHRGFSKKRRWRDTRRNACAESPKRQG